ncbi:MAG: aminodeoxychorismate lyase [Lentimonas sp.]|jgi:aminodeoxychorismate lyase
MKYVILNHKLIESGKAGISPADRGFRFGDGIFETCLIANGVIYNWSAHFARLEAGLKAIKIPFISRKLLTCCEELIKNNNVKNGILRIAISRGVGSLGYLPKQNIKPTLLIETLKKPPKTKSLIKLMISSYQKPSLNSLPVNYKLANGLNSTLTRIEAVEKGFFDGITLNDKNQVCETSSANIFWVKDDVVFTPHLDCGCLNGTIRSKIIESPMIEVRLVKAVFEDLLDADEVFLTNVALPILNVDAIEQVKFTDKKYGKIFADLLKKEIKRICQ